MKELKWKRDLLKERLDILEADISYWKELSVKNFRAWSSPLRDSTRFYSVDEGGLDKTHKLDRMRPKTKT